jgi:hypothetical protein
MTYAAVNAAVAIAIAIIHGRISEAHDLHV